MNPEIDRYQSDPLYAYLDKKVITLPGKPPHVPAREILLLESCNLVSIRTGNIRGQVALRPRDELSGGLDSLYAPLAGCSFGNVPSVDEFLAMPDADINLWITEARTVNHEFSDWLDAAQKILTPEAEKKKEKKPSKSVTG